MNLLNTITRPLNKLSEAQVTLAFRIMALCVFGGAVNHIICVFVPSFDPTQSLAEHIFWVLANFTAIYFILFRTAKLVPVLVVWTLQQWYFHGTWFITYWQQDGSISFRDLGPVLFMPILLVVYWWDTNRHST